MRADQPSSTAVLIARSILLSAQDPLRRRLVAPGEPAWLTSILNACSPARWFDYCLRYPWAGRWLWRAERASLPGIFLHYLARKRWIEREVRRAVGEGITQVVVLGAGFDTLASRLKGSHAEINFIEVDHPATQGPKRRAFGDTAGIAWCAANLAIDSPAVALRTGAQFFPERPTLFIAEGLLMYFTENRVAALFRELATLARPRSQLIFSFMEPALDGKICFRGEAATVGWWLSSQREPFHWGLARAQLAGFLLAHGWQSSAVVDHAALRAQILAPAALDHLPLAQGECLCHCHTSSP